MKQHPWPHLQRVAQALAAIGLAALLASCGGGSSSNPPANFSVTNLVSDGAVPARHTDPNLVNGWGVAFNPNGFVWVADNGTSTSTLYDGNGVPQSLVVGLPAGVAGDAAPTGIVFNPTNDFTLSQNGLSGKAAFIFVGEAGTVSAWSPAVDFTHTVTVVDTGNGGAVYKGLALASFNGANLLYAADFRHRRIDVYNATFARVNLPGAFVDPALPADYTPFNVAAHGDRIYVAYAQFTAPNTDENAGPGLGIVSLFDTGGNFIKRLVTGGHLDAPWGMAFAPTDFAGFPSALLIGNFGDGTINAYSPDTGAFLGTLAGADNRPLVIDGLWGIAFGNDLSNQPHSTLFFAAGPEDEAHGLYGRIDALPGASMP